MDIKPIQFSYESEVHKIPTPPKPSQPIKTKVHKKNVFENLEPTTETVIQSPELTKKNKSKTAQQIISPTTTVKTEIEPYMEEEKKGGGGGQGRSVAVQKAQQANMAKTLPRYQALFAQYKDVKDPKNNLVSDTVKRSINKEIPNLVKIGVKQSYAELLETIQEAIKQRTVKPLTADLLQQHTKLKSPNSPLLNKNARGASKELQFG